MEIVETIDRIKTLRRHTSGNVGFVPTMGYLHDGHISLVKQSIKENSYTVASIFVNPTQFSPTEDLQKYPRNLDRDLSLLKEAGTDFVFIPSDEEMYPQGFNSWVEVLGITDYLEGGSRPGHFKGVATVVTKLFNIVEPDKSYFGQKDAQQVAVIKKMVSELNMNVKIITLPTVRESDGLAMSSRNVYLSPQERHAACILFKALSHARSLYKEGSRDANTIRQQIISLIKQEPLARIDYVSIADTETLTEINEITHEALASLAVFFGKTRLIDNIVLRD